MISLRLLILFAVCSIVHSEFSFKVDKVGHQFLLDGEPFQYLAGEIHYFRIPTGQWEDRLRRVRSMGLNAITVPVPWNLHKRHQDSVPDFTGNLDLAKFIQMAQANDLYTIIRLGPYIAGDWENGGLPWWLIKNNHIRKLRSNDQAFMSEVSQWWNFLLTVLQPLMRNNGGPVLMAQIEHYYGLTGFCDQDYLLSLSNIAKKYLGRNTVLFSVDLPMKQFLLCGRIPGILPTIEVTPTNDPRAVEGWFQQQQDIAAGGPRVGSQFLLGRAQYWGLAIEDPFKDQKGSYILPTIQAAWALNASLSFSMVDGGTNFGFWNGLNNPYPVATTHDFFAPISESGASTSKLITIRNFITDIAGWKNKPTPVPPAPTKKLYPPVTMTPVDTIINFVKSEKPKCWANTMSPMTAEDMNQGYGLVLYQTSISECGQLSLSKYADDAYVFLNGNYVGALYNQMQNIHNNTIDLKNCFVNQNDLEIVVEISGRSFVGNPSISKGLQGDVSLNNKIISNWKNCQVPWGTTNLNTVKNGKKVDNNVTPNIDTREPSIFHGILEIISEPIDTYIDTRGWGKGFITVNDYNIGRYWSTVGPQQTLYVPSDFLVEGTNYFMFYEFEGAGEACGTDLCTLEFSNRTIFTKV